MATPTPATSSNGPVPSVQADRVVQKAASSEIMRDFAIEEALAALRDEPLYWKAKRAVKEELIKSRYSAANASTAILDFLRSSGLDVEIKSHAYERLRRERRRYEQAGSVLAPGLPPPPLPVPLDQVSTLDSIEWARWRWAYMTLARLRELSRELRQPFLRPRDLPQGGVDGAEEEEVNTRHVVDLQNLYTLLTTEMRERMATSSAAGRAGAVGAASQSLRWAALGPEIAAPSAPAILRERYAELIGEARGQHLAAYGGPGGSLDDAGIGGALGEGEAELAEKRTKAFRLLLARPYPPQLHLLARRGVPPGLRREVWAQCLLGSSDLAANDRGALQDVARDVCTWEWLTDDIIRLDVAELCGNDPCYFPFDEIVEAMVLALSRDASVSSSCDCGPPQIPVAAGAEPPSTGLVPPSGVVPFKCFSCYACPFAFLSDRLETIYPLFRAFYCRYLSRLHTISSHQGTLLSLCATFETLLARRVPHVCCHLSQLGAVAQPLRVAFPWIVRGFVGFLRVDQLLALWDRILGFDSTEPIALLAAAIFVYRSKQLLAVRSATEVDAAIGDLSSLRAVPLLQFLLDGGSASARASDAVVA
eukprot:TRINITY_DN11130_c0_g1_i3.p1 TRINITY_DN11130_c0_g1~~TRINITY_DN11130_c0_g1_i3.p1  ORF type:complete len:592 (+),score=134.53 TRINITY_DN11130_c0_g1_i3:90-1865(+)